MSSSRKFSSEIRKFISPYLELLISGQIEFQPKDSKFLSAKSFGLLSSDIVNYMLTFLLDERVTGHVDEGSAKAVKRHQSYASIMIHHLPLKIKGQILTRHQAGVYLNATIDQVPEKRSKSEVKKVELEYEKYQNYQKIKEGYEMVDDTTASTQYAKRHLIHPKSPKTLAPNSNFSFIEIENENMAIFKLSSLIYSSFNILMMKKGDWILILGLDGGEGCPEFMWDGISVVPTGNDIYDYGTVPMQFPINEHQSPDYFSDFLRRNEDICWFDLKGNKFKKIKEIFNYSVFEVVSYENMCIAHNQRPWIYITPSLTPLLDTSPALCRNQVIRRINFNYFSDENPKLKSELFESIQNKFQNSLKIIEELRSLLSDMKNEDVVSIENRMFKNFYNLNDDNNNYPIIEMMRIPISLLTNNLLINNHKTKIPENSVAHRNFVISMLYIYESFFKMAVTYGYTRILLSINTESDNRIHSYESHKKNFPTISEIKSFPKKLSSSKKRKSETNIIYCSDESDEE